MMQEGLGFPCETGKESNDILCYNRAKDRLFQYPISRVQFIRGTAVKTMGRYIVLILFAFLVYDVFGDTDAVKEGDPFILNTDVPKEHDDIMKWYFNNTLIALINGHHDSSCSYDGEGRRFRGRLKMNYKTGSLTITNITTEHTGHYEAEIIESKSSDNSQKMEKIRTCNSTKIITKKLIMGKIIKTFNLNVIASDSKKNKNEAQIAPEKSEIVPTPASKLFPGAVAGIVVAVLLVVVATAVGVINCRHRIFQNEKKKNNQGLLEKI